MEYLNISSEILQDRKLKPIDKLVLAYLLVKSEYGSTNGCYCFASDKTISNDLGVDKRTMQRSLDYLLSNNYIKKEEPQKGKRSIRVIKNYKMHVSSSVKMTFDGDSKRQNDSVKMTSKENAECQNDVRETSKCHSKDVKMTSNYNKDYIKVSKGSISLFTLIDNININNKPSDAFLKRHEQLISELVNQFGIAVNQDTTVPEEEKESAKEMYLQKYVECLMDYFKAYENKRIEDGNEPVHGNAGISSLNRAANTIYQMIKNPKSKIMNQFLLALDLYFEEKWKGKNGEDCDYRLWHFTNPTIISMVEQKLDKTKSQKKQEGKKEMAFDVPDRLKFLFENDPNTENAINIDDLTFN